MLLLLIDENFNHRILRGLRLRVPALDVVIVQETAMQGLQDPLLLREAALAADLGHPRSQNYAQVCVCTRRCRRTNARYHCCPR